MDILDEWGQGITIEEMDGFFWALIAGPKTVTPSEYLPEVFGGDPNELRSVDTIAEGEWMFSLMKRHFNDIAATLAKGGIHEVLLLSTDDGVTKGNAWARGFIQGTKYSSEEWNALLRDEGCNGCLIPVLMLYHEHDDDPKMKTTPPITPEKRKLIFDELPAALEYAYRDFHHPETTARRNRAAGRGRE
jgi:uncharacterized protein